MGPGAECPGQQPCPRCHAFPSLLCGHLRGPLGGSYKCWQKGFTPKIECFVEAGRKCLPPLPPCTSDSAEAFLHSSDMRILRLKLTFVFKLMKSVIFLVLDPLFKFRYRFLKVSSVHLLYMSFNAVWPEDLD